MKTAIIFESKHGATEKCIQTLSQNLEGEVVLCNLKKDSMVNLNNFEHVVIGGPIYMGQLPKRIRQVLNENESALISKKFGIFACGMAEGDEGIKELKAAYSTTLVERATAVGFFGGAFYVYRMNLFEKFVLKMVSKSKGALAFEKGPEGEFIENYNENEIIAFSKLMNLV